MRKLEFWSFPMECLDRRGRLDFKSRPLFEVRRDRVLSQAFPESQSGSRVSKVYTSLGLDLVSVSFFDCTLGVDLVWCLLGESE